MHGHGTLIIGIGIIASGIVQAFAGVEAGSVFIVIGVVGLAVMLYAQFKYNRGIFKMLKASLVTGDASAIYSVLFFSPA